MALKRTAQRPVSRAMVNDPRLRGLSSSGLSGFRPDRRPSLSALDRDMSKLRYDVMHPDPYAEAASAEREIGRRMPLPYQAPSALAGTLPLPASNYESQYTDLHSRRAVTMAPSLAGRRETFSGTFGDITAQANPWTARDRFGYGRAETRGGGGTAEEWDNRPTLQRRSGKWTQQSKSAQVVDPRWPALVLVAKGSATSGGNRFDGNAMMRVTAGLHDTGGAETSREFWIGGGYVALFNMQGWDQCTIEVLEILDGTNVQFAWVTQTDQSTDHTLYLPQRVATAGGAVPVPEGAYALVIEDPDFALPGTVFRLNWITAGAALPGDVTMTVDVDDGSTGSNNQFGLPLPILGTAIDFAGLVPGGGPDFIDVVWFLRTI